MIYLSQLLGNPVYDAKGENIGRVNDLGIATGEVFPRVTSLAIEGPSRTPFMLSWRKYVDTYNENEVRLKVVKTDIRFSYLQPDEVLIARDLLNKQIVDTRGVRVVRVNDLKLSDTNSSQLRLLGAEVGARGLLRTLSPKLEHAVLKIAKAMGKTIPEKIIAWNYMDLLDRDLSDVKLSVTHKTLDDMHPADIADIIERLDPRLRGQVFAQLDAEQKAGTIAEFDDDTIAADIMSSMNDTDASQMLSEMDPDDAAELVGELDYDKAEKLLRLMGVKEQRAVRQLLGYKEDTAGRIMTSEVVDLFENDTVADAVEVLSNLDEDFETIHYIYIKDKDDKLTGAVSLNALLLAKDEDHLKDIADIEDLKTANPDDDQEDVAEESWTTRDTCSATSRSTMHWMSSTKSTPRTCRLQAPATTTPQQKDARETLPGSCATRHGSSSGCSALPSLLPSSTPACPGRISRLSPSACRLRSLQETTLLPS